MARVLIAATAVPGHVWPLLAVARHLVGLGHDVVLHTGSAFRDRAEATGARFAPFRPAIDLDYRRLDEHFPQRRAIPPGVLQVAFGLKHLFADAVPHQYDGLRDILAEFRADAIIVDTMFCGVFPLLLGRREARPPVVSLGISALALSSVDTAPFGMALPPPGTQEERIRNAALNRQFQEVIFAETQSYFNSVLARLGVPPLPAFLFDSMITLPDLYLQLATPAFEYPRRDLPATVRFIGPIAPPSPNVDLPPWWDMLDGSRPVVVVTQGTLQNADFSELVGPTLTALAAEPVIVVATTGGPIDAIPVALPSNAQASSFLPFDRLLPKAAVLVTNGGYGAVTQALSQGVPLVVAGNSEEKPEIAARVAWSGAGINLRTGRPSVPQIRDAVRALLTRPQYRQRAEVIRDDFARHNALDRIAELVDALARGQGAIAGRNCAADRQFQDQSAGGAT